MSLVLDFYCTMEKGSASSTKKLVENIIQRTGRSVFFLRYFHRTFVAKTTSCLHFVQSFCALQKHQRNFADNPFAENQFSHFYQKGLPDCYTSRKTMVKQKNTRQLLEAKGNCYTNCETFILTQVSVSP